MTFFACETVFKTLKVTCFSNQRGPQPPSADPQCPAPPTAFIIINNIAWGSIFVDPPGPPTDRPAPGYLPCPSQRACSVQHIRVCDWWCVLSNVTKLVCCAYLCFPVRLRVYRGFCSKHACNLCFREKWFWLNCCVFYQDSVDIFFALTLRWFSHFDGNVLTFLSVLFNSPLFSTLPLLSSLVSVFYVSNLFKYLRRFLMKVLNFSFLLENFDVEWHFEVMLWHIS